jgi:hypothetical protein
VLRWTAADLVASVRRTAQLPSSGGKLSNADILALADEETRDTVAPVVRRAQEGFSLATVDVPTVQGKADYRVPYRAQGSAMQDLTLVDAAGNEFTIPRIDLTDGPHYRITASPQWPGRVAFAMFGDRIRLYPIPQDTRYTLRMTYYRRPSALALPSDARVATVTAVGSAPTYSVTGGAALTTGVLVDAMPALPGMDAYADDVAVGSTGSGTITLAAAVAGLEVGDYLAAAGYTPIPQVPFELSPALVHATVQRVLEAIGDRKGAELAEKRLGRALQGATVLIQPRVQGSTRKVINMHSPLRTGWRYR